MGPQAAIIRRTDGWNAVGAANVNGHDEATMWFGQGVLTTSFAPQDTVTSSLWDIFGGRQSGSFTYDDGIRRAGARSGTANSVIDLHPGGAYNHSVARGIYENNEVGGAYTDGYWHAASWQDSANSFLDMHPSEFKGSMATDVDKERACGYAYNNTIDSLTDCEAMIWNTSNGSWTNINPGGAVASKAWGINQRLAVGYATYDYYPRATLWNLRNNTLIDLQSVLEIYNPYFLGSMAFDVWYQGDYVTVCGMAYDLWSGQPHAVIWAGML